MAKKEARATYKRWLSDGCSWIGVFQNQVFDSSDFGRIISLCFDDKQWESAEIGQTKAPDHLSIGSGWRYLLILKTRDPEEALNLVFGKEQ